MTAESRIMDAKRIIDAWKLDEKNEPATLEAGYQHSMRVISYRRVEELINDVLAALEEDVPSESVECPECHGYAIWKEIQDPDNPEPDVDMFLCCTRCSWKQRTMEPTS